MSEHHDPADRRERRRREIDVEEGEIIEHAIHDAPIVNRLLRTGRVAAATLSLGALAGGACAALGIRYIGPKDDVDQLSSRVDTNARSITHLGARTDSLVLIMTDVRHTLETIAFIQCVQLRRSDSDLRPQGCDEAVARHETP